LFGVSVRVACTNSMITADDSGYDGAMAAGELGLAGLQGWRAKVADVAGPAVAHRTPLAEDQVKAAIGLLFFALAVVYVAKTLKEWVSRP
jgi:hypothetical protein